MRKLAPLVGRRDVQEFVLAANATYHYWDTFRYRPTPADLAPEEAWWLVKLSRSPLRETPILDPKGKPFRFWVPPSAARTLHLVDLQGGGRLASDGDDAPIVEQARQRILIESRMEEGISTSQIEGAVTTIELGKELLRSGRAPATRNEQMVVNGYRTMQRLIEQKDRSLDRAFLFEIQRSMTEGTLDQPDYAGRFRTTRDKPVVIVDERDNEVVFEPPPAGTVEARMETLITFANEPADAGEFIHPLVRAAILHFWLAYEHPFLDGNGRTARALFYWYMLRSGYWLFEFLTISRVIHASRMDYYRAFRYAERDDNDLTYFLLHQLQVTQKSIEQLHERIRVAVEQERNLSAVRTLRSLNARQRSVVQHALRHANQVYTFESHMHAQGITYQTARTDLLGLRDRGFLVDLGTKKPMQFVPAKRLREKLRL